MLDKNTYSSFRERLENNHAWPSLYMFKFIVPTAKQKEVRDLFPKNELSTKYSKNGKYISVTARVMIGNSDEVIQIYEKAHKIEGVIAL
ncbi:MAG: DUF493 family protein [Candidatus Cyclobacteriaceae bacterium M3_2C_046]